MLEKDFNKAIDRWLTREDIMEDEEMKKIDSNKLSKLFEECKNISLLKNSDYGCDTLLEFGELGILIRMNDKMWRLKNIIGNKTLNVKDETIQDTCKDLINYAAYLCLLNKGELIE